MNHKLTLRWRGEGLTGEQVEAVVRSVSLHAGVDEGEWVGHRYDQCDENWEPVGVHAQGPYPDSHA